MNAQQTKHLREQEQNPLASIFFICGALHVYSSVKADRRNRWQLVKTGIEILTPVMMVILTVFLLGAAIVEAIEVLINVL